MGARANGIAAFHSRISARALPRPSLFPLCQRTPSGASGADGGAAAQP